MASLCFILGGCGLRPPTSAAYVLELRLPGLLMRTEARRSRFEARAQNLEVSLQSLSAGQKVFNFPPSQWSQLPLLDFPLSGDPAEKVQINVRIWDRDRAGSPRGHPALSGKAVVRCAERALAGPTPVPIRLSLRVPVSEYD